MKYQYSKPECEEIVLSYGKALMDLPLSVTGENLDEPEEYIPW